VVYLAWDANLHRSVALKVMKRSIAENESSRQRFILEARATAAVDHDHIVTIYQVGDHNGVPYLVMKYLEGQTLEDLIRKHKIIQPLEAVRISRQIAEGLDAAHRCNLIHRDIKPSNIWLETIRSRVKILDFGLARISDSADPNITQTGVILGTPAYMSPEQAAGLNLDGRSDLFSLGTVLYRMVTGKPPFRGSNNLAILRSLSIDQPVPPNEHNPQIPPRLSNMILKLLEKEPDARPSSAMLLAQLLETIEQDLASGSQDSFRADSFLGNSATRFEAISTLDEIRETPAWVATGPSNLAGVNLDNISLAPVDEDEDASDKKNAKARPSAKTTATVEAAVEPKKPQKVEVSPLLRKLAEQAAMQDEEDDESSYIFDSRSATLNQWKRQNYWDNFPWRPIIFTMSLILSVVVVGIAVYTFFPSEWLGGAAQ
jgi:serine/threonine protein kinase